MKFPFDPHQGIGETIRQALAAAGLGQPAPGASPASVGETIRRTLSAAGVWDEAREHPRDDAPSSRPDEPHTIDVEARVVTGADARPELDAELRAAPGTAAPGTAAPQAHAEPRPASPAAAPGRFLRREHRGPAGRLAYRVYLPAARSAAAPALVVMLHGCTQSAEDFAAGTRMNAWAEHHGLIVVYPEQSGEANLSRCWNWFEPKDQRRDAGEPSLIAGSTRDAIAEHGADPQRVYVAGLSAGAAMAMVLSQAYPELYAAVGVHSGVPFGAAHDMPSAFVAMKGRRSGTPRGEALAALPHAVPTIVFHGDRDPTVRPSNGVDLAQQARAAHVAAHGPLQTQTSRGTAQGRSYTRSIDAAADGRPRVESWLLHGAGHAWSGGDASGSYADAGGPDASAEMLRFFLAQPGPLAHGKH